MNKLPDCGYKSPSSNKCSHTGIGKYCRHPKNQKKCECYNEWLELINESDELNNNTKRLKISYFIPSFASKEVLYLDVDSNDTDFI